MDPRTVEELRAALAEAEHARAEAERARAALQELFDAAPVAMIATDGERNVRMFNRAAERLLGWTRDEVIGRTPPIFSDAFREECARLSARVRSGETIVAHETRRLAKNGTEVPVAVSLSSTAGTAGGRHVLAVLEDITERKQLLAGLEAAQREMNDVIDGIDHGIYRVPLAARESGTFISRRAEEIFGLSREELVSPEKWFGRIHPEDRRRVETDLAAYVDGPVSVEYRFRHGTTDEWRWIETSMSPRFVDGRVVEVFGVSRDVTSRKEMEAALAVAEAQRRDLVDLVVHDLKGPLATILANVRFVQREADLSSDARDALQDARTAAESAGRMALNLLDVSRSEEGRLQARRIETDVALVLREAANAARHRLSERNQALALDLAIDGTAEVDRDLLVRIVENLLDNAFKYGQAGGTISLLARAEAGALRIEVADDGPGVPPEMRERIFDKTIRLDRDASKHLRTSRGLGLHFCRLAAQAHGGSVEVIDNAPAGARFVVRLPARMAPRQAPERAGARPGRGATAS